MHFFSPSSPWNTDVSTAPLDSDSGQITQALADEVSTELGTGRGPSISTTSYSVPIYTVPPSQPTVFVRLVGHSNAPALQAAWRAVPLPPNAIPAAGTDGHLVVWQPGTDRLWEFWRLAHTGEGWQASWGGAIKNVSLSSGVYGPESWPKATSSWGGSASALSIAGGVITFEDLRKGSIDHALALGLPNIRANVFAAPAMRTDGWSHSPSSLPEGAHLRLDPSLDLAALHLPPFTLMLAKAAQRYGLIVRDVASNVTLYAQDPTPTGENPYRGPGGFFEGTYPAKLLSSFPWRRLQLLEMQLASVGS